VAGNTLNLLYIDDHLSETAELGKRLRQRGQVVREVRANTLADVQRTVAETPPDLVLYGAEVREPRLAAVREVLEALGQQPAIVVLGYGDDACERSPWLRAGARDLVPAADLDLAELVALREIGDLHLRRRALETAKLLEETDARCRSLLDHAGEAIAYVHEGAHVYMNPAYLALFGYQDGDELEGLPLMNLVAESERYELRKLLKAYTRGKRDVDRVSVTGIRADGSSFAGEIQLQMTAIEGEPCAQVTFVDTGTPAEVKGQLASLHQRDPLTGLYNRHHFKVVLDQTHDQARKHQGNWALLYLLLNHHGEICATHGLTAGDELVRTVGGLIERSVGAEVLTARYAESIFTLLLPAESPELAEALAERLRAAIEQLVVQADSRIIATTCCIGVRMIDELTADAAEVIAHANQACEEARQSGGNRVVVHGARAAAEAADLSACLGESLEQAIAEGRLFFQYQPIASLKGGGGERFEACLRVRDGEGGGRSLEEIFPRAQELGLLARAERWATRQAVEILREAVGQGRQLTLLLKISANTLLSQDFSQELRQLLAGAPGLVLAVELALAEKYYRQTLDLAQALRRHGAKLALVSFGRSGNGERLIGLLQPDMVRFDSALVEKLGQDSQLQKYVDSVAERLRSAGGEAIAGGIISAQQLASIWQTELALIQGDFVAAPQESMAFDFEQFVA